MNPNTYFRKSFSVEAAEVTADNMAEIAEWCQGEIQEDEKGKKFIDVRVHNPLSDRQRKAYVGDWVLYASKGYKVYTAKAFERSFESGDNAETRNVFENNGNVSNLTSPPTVGVIAHGGGGGGSVSAKPGDGEAGSLVSK